ncbi:MAG TPA: alpha-amylase family glycosyl hydrolase [Chitinophagaceae bacterium]|nr:alpha-amylase family glycosyl hydrolase [Chitinophagaceae bacterium]
MNNDKPVTDQQKAGNIYEVNIRQYTTEGTFNAFAAHLPRLKDMGVDILWFMPVTPIGKVKRLGTLGSYYACSSYTAINPEFGTMDDFKALIATIHNMGMKVIIDWVANHTGRDHEWVAEHPDWYVRDANGNFSEQYGWADVIHLDYTKMDMRKKMIESMCFWISECNIDGFRCDMAHLVPLEFWLDAKEQCEELKSLFWLAECDHIEYHAVFDVTYAWEWMHVSEKVVKGMASIGQMKDVLFKYAQYPKGARKLYFTSNHDENTWNGTEYEKYQGAAKAFAVFTLTWPGMPLIYSGQELPNVKRLKFFDKDFIDWKPTVVLHNFYKNMLALRKANTCLHGDIQPDIIATGHDDKIFAYILHDEKSKVLVLLNFSPVDKVRINIGHQVLEGPYKNVTSGLEYTLMATESFEMQAWEFMVYEGLQRLSY